MSRETFMATALDLLANESVPTVLRRDRAKELEKEDNKEPNYIDLESLYKLYMQPAVLNKYEEKYRQLTHVDKNANKLRGYIYFANTAVGDKGDLVAFVSVKLQSGKTWIDCLEVDPKYRGNKLSHQLLDVACKEFGATDLRVHKDNTKAINIFKKYGFTEYDSKDNYLYMTNEDVQTSNPVLKKEDAAKESYVDSYVKAHVKAIKGVDTSSATESIFEKKSKEELVNDAIAKVRKKCDTEDKKALFKANITNNERAFKQSVKYLKDLDKKHNKGILNDADYKKEYKRTMNLIHKIMIEFNINIDRFIDNKDAPTAEEIDQFNGIITKIKKSI